MNQTFHDDIVNIHISMEQLSMTWNAAEPFIVGYLIYFESEHPFSKRSRSINFIHYEGFSWELNLSDRYDMQSSALKNDWTWNIAVWTAILATLPTASTSFLP